MNAEAVTFDKSADRFPRTKGIPLANCGKSQLSRGARDQAIIDLEHEHLFGDSMYRENFIRECNDRLRKAGAKLFNSGPENIAYIDNVAHGLNLIALGMSWKKGDTILVYDKEYPSNLFPWTRPDHEEWPLRAKFVQGSLFEGRAHKVTVEDFERAIDSTTRAIAVSQVQYTSGYSIDLVALGVLCKKHGLLFVVDAAQSAGCLPIHPRKCGADIVVTSGWKWLRGLNGSGLMYISSEYLEVLRPGLYGPDHRVQSAYEDLNYTVKRDASKEEYSSLPKICVAALAGAIEEDGVGRYPIESIWTENKRLQDLFLSRLDATLFRRVPLEEHERSGILSFVTAKEPATIRKILYSDQSIPAEKRLNLPTPRGDYLRVGIHFDISDEEALWAAARLNKAAR